MLRSLMFVPAANERFVRKAAGAGADAIILDLEDSVAGPDKDRARAGLAHAVTLLAGSGSKIFVRVNADDRLMDDIDAAREARADGLVLPKVSGAEAIGTIEARLEAGRARADFALIPVLEHPAAILRAEAVARASRRIIGLIAGGEDLALAMNADPSSEAVRMCKLLVHLAAKSAGLLSFGLFGSIADYRDAAKLSACVEEARRSGFDGATCIHPSAIPILNRGFFPSPEEVSHARRLLAAHAGRSEKGAFEFEGRMVDAPHVSKARNIVRLADRQV